jgi:hypothetical protein
VKNLIAPGAVEGEDVAWAGILCNEELRSLIKSSDFSGWKFWRLTLVIWVLIGKKVALLKKAMKMQGREGVCTVEAGQCIQ